MKYKRISLVVVILCLSVVLVYSVYGCQLIKKHDAKQVLKAYTSEESRFQYYTFKAKVRGIREVAPHEYQNRNYYEFEVDKDYFEQQYSNDEYVFKDGTKRWEGAYAGFNKHEFMIISSSFNILSENGGIDLLVEGAEVIISANNYFGWDGWKYPILSLTVENVTYLDFETGKENYLNFVRAGFQDS